MGARIPPPYRYVKLASMAVQTLVSSAAPVRRYWILGVLLLAVAAAGAIAFALRPAAAPQIATAPIVRKTLVTLITATGTVNPQDTINVGTQVSGTVQTIAADYNDRVHAGQVLARLDPTLFQATLKQAESALAQARSQWQAGLANAEGSSSNAEAALANARAAAENVQVARAAETSADAAVGKARAALTLAQQTLTRDRTLLQSGYIAQSQYDSDFAGEISAAAALRSAEVTADQTRIQLRSAGNAAAAGAASGRAAGAQATGSRRSAAAQSSAIDAAQAQVDQATINLAHATIVSPVDGTVIARNVSMGQTVAASFQTPTLFTIAKDLTKMEIDLAVGEPDIGNVRTGQPVDFTVLAFPDQTFHGVVAQVRENPTTLQNVVTYDSVVYERNVDGRLRPGMTANASIQVARADRALVVPLAALTFRNPAQAGRNPPSGATAPTAWGNAGLSATAPLARGNIAQINIVENGALHPTAVRVVLASGTEVAIEPLGSALAPGTAVAVSMTARNTPSAAPRAPGMFR